MRGKLRIYLGYAPGVGKTYAMLNEARRRAHRGTDVVVGVFETHGRENTAAQAEGLEVIPPRQLTYRGRTFEEMDLDAILARRPAVALVDELAHTNVPGSRHEKRWQDVEELLDAGIDVTSTLNVQHLESLNDVVQTITGITQLETIPDRAVRASDQIELVDMSPEALRRRMAHGNIYPAERVDTALGNYFRTGNLTALRELALLWLTDKVDEGLQAYREAHGIAHTWETKERVVVAVTGSPKGDQLIRRGARMAARARAELIGVHVRTTDGLSQPGAATALTRHRALLNELGGRFEEVTGADPAKALVDFARAHNATQLILGATHRSRWAELIHGSVINQVIRASKEIDVHVITTAESPGEDTHEPGLPSLVRRGRLAPLPARRLILGWTLALAGIPLLTLALIPARSSIHDTGALPLLLLGAVAVAAVGGLWPGLAGAVVAFGLADWYFIAPIHSFTIGRPGDTVALVAFLVAAAVVSLMADQLVRRGLEAARRQAESEALARLAGGALLTSPQALGDIASELQQTFSLDNVAILVPDEPSGDDQHRTWTVQVSAGSSPPATPEDAGFTQDLGGGTVLALSAPNLSARDRALLGAFIAQLRLAQQHHDLEAVASHTRRLEEANDLRGALLAAVSHDLRTPLAVIKASADSVLADDVTWSATEVRSFCQTISDETDRLNVLVANLLDLSRLNAGALHLSVRPVHVDEVLHGALVSLRQPQRVRVDIGDDFPPVLADPALLERVLANLIDNAVRWSPADKSVFVQAGVIGDRIDLQVVDHGPGIPPDQRDTVLRPFQRLGDEPGLSHQGVGLGFAVVAGFTSAMHGELSLDDTPNGGLTVTVRLPAAPAPAEPADPAPAVPAPARAGPPPRSERNPLGRDDSAPRVRPPIATTDQ